MRAGRTLGRVALVLLALALGCAGPRSSGPDRETVETRVVANGDQVLLRWSERHPWDSELLARGAMLVAEYGVRGGGVALDCLSGEAMPVGAGRRGTPAAGCVGLAGEPVGPREDRTLRFRLPEATQGRPVGPVCLHIRLPSRRVLPVRRAEPNGTGTARFRHPAWEDAATAAAERRVLEARVEQLRRNVDVKRRDVEAQEAINAREGWTSGPACEAIEPPTLEAGPSERPLAPPGEREEIAREVCTMRVWYADSLATGASVPNRLRRGVVEPPTVVDGLLSLLPTGWQEDVVAGHRVRAAAFRRDWERLAPGIRRYRDGIHEGGWRQPHFGGFGDALRLQSITIQAARRVAEAFAGQEPAGAEDVSAVAGGMLEAYDRCVADGQAQLATSYRNAVELREREPQVREGLRRGLVDRCHAGLGDLEALRAEQAALEDDLRQAEAELAGVGVPRPLPSVPRDLNGATCETGFPPAAPS